ncbi:hypothetical protein B0H16DRAFT_356750 [Mycena metata]|uniref:Transmembrane protein n=1 Tax=Mycena metata TaxID=1033252 RepID=A0AAD7JNV2_9AGAR|nr:hypothetical protein B0H16DRAFT_356750 [Mycena metata]
MYPSQSYLDAQGMQCPFLVPRLPFRLFFNPPSFNPPGLRGGAGSFVLSLFSLLPSFLHFRCFLCLFRSSYSSSMFYIILPSYHPISAPKGNGVASTRQALAAQSRHMCAAPLSQGMQGISRPLFLLSHHSRLHFSHSLPRLDTPFFVLSLPFFVSSLPVPFFVSSFVYFFFSCFIPLSTTALPGPKGNQGVSRASSRDLGISLPDAQCGGLVARVLVAAVWLRRVTGALAAFVQPYSPRTWVAHGVARNALASWLPPFLFFSLFFFYCCLRGVPWSSSRSRGLGVYLIPCLGPPISPGSGTQGTQGILRTSYPSYYSLLRIIHSFLPFVLFLSSHHSLLPARIGRSRLISYFFSTPSSPSLPSIKC